MALPAHWLVPDWPAPANVRAACATRAGGVSAAPYDSLNLGDHVGDDPAAVAVNRARHAQALGARPVFLRQVHGFGVVRLDAGTADGCEADACVSTVPGLACTMMVADCLPVLLCDARGTAVAAAHAGWRGLAGAVGQGVLESVTAAFQAAARLQTDELGQAVQVWLGPCIGPGAFEVGPEVKAAFEAAQGSQASGFFTPAGAGKWRADLAGLARQRLQALGYRRIHGNDGGSGWCTVNNPSRFFSHRRDRVSGRFAASVWLS